MIFVNIYNSIKVKKNILRINIIKSVYVIFIFNVNKLKNGIIIIKNCKKII